MFRLPQDAQVSVNGVPVGLSDGIGIQAVRPGPHQIILNVAGKETTHRVNVASHAIFTITIAGVVATEP
jgi:CRISPR/Cas system-associated exonuclease Cas4 (RecB family)